MVSGGGKIPPIGTNWGIGVSDGISVIVGAGVGVDVSVLVGIWVNVIVGVMEEVVVEIKEGVLTGVSNSTEGVRLVIVGKYFGSIGLGWKAEPTYSRIIG